MDDELLRSSQMTSATSNDAFQDSILQNNKISEYRTEKYNAQNEEEAQNVNDLKNIPTTRVETSDEDNESELLSTEVEQTENQSQPLTDVESSTEDCEEKLASVLHERSRRLQLEMSRLREILNKEIVLWRKEKEDFQLLRERSDALAFEEATAAARAAAAAYATESPLSNNLNNIIDITSDQSIRELSILEYEKSLAKYQDAYSFEQAEQRYNLYKRALVDAYKEKLSEVERLCNEELKRIHESASCLKSFKEIASQWFVEDKDRGDANRNYNCETYTEQFKIINASFDKNDRCVLGNVDDGINMIPEILSTQFI